MFFKVSFTKAAFIWINFIYLNYSKNINIVNNLK